MGVKYNQWSCNSNGQIQLGTVAIDAYAVYPQGTVPNATNIIDIPGSYSYDTPLSYPIIAAMGGDNALLANGTGSVKYAISGTAPNRKLVIEYSGFILDYDVYTSTSPNKFQVWLEETTSNVYFIYGTLTNRSITTASTDGIPGFFAYLGLGSTQQMLKSTGSQSASTSAAASYQFPAVGANLAMGGGSSQGTRAQYTWSPVGVTALAAPTIGTVTSTTSSITVNWTNVSAATAGYTLYYNTSAASIGTPYIASNSSTIGRIDVAAGATSATIPSLGEAGTYYISLYSKREGLSVASTTTKTLAPLAYSLSGVTVTQAGSGLVLPGSNNVPVLGLAVNITGNNGTFPLNSIALTFPTMVPAIASSTFTGARVYRTSTNVFSTANPLGTVVSVGASGVTISSTNAGSGLNYNFTYGTTYIWVAVNISASASPAANIDLQIAANGINIGANTSFPASLANPTGSYNTATNTYTFESGLGTWIAQTGQTGQWITASMPYGQLSGANSVAAILPGAGPLGTSTNVLGTGFSAAVPASSTYSIVSPIFNASGTTNIVFAQYYDLNNNSTYYGDSLRFEYSTNGGTTWRLVSKVTGNSGGWLTPSYTLTSANNDKVRFRFTIKTVDGLFGGAFIDNFGVNFSEYIDNTPPTVTINTAISNPVFRGTQVATNLATITDSEIGLDITNLPKVYYKKTTDANNLASWKSVSASGTTSPFSFSLTATQVGGFDEGDTIQYFVVAQDLAPIPNVGYLSNITFSSAPTSTTLVTANFPVTGSGIKKFVILPDNTKPTITITTPIVGVANTSVISALNLATITDAGTGVQRSTSNNNRPRLYYKKSTDANTFANWRYVTASGGVSPFSFYLGLDLLPSTISGGDEINYFVVAQDSASSPNVALSHGLTFSLLPGSVALQTGNFPVNGTPGSFTIPVTPKTLTSVTVSQPQTTAAVQSSTSFPVLKLTMVVAGNSGTLPLNSLIVNLPSYCAASDISRVRLYSSQIDNFSYASPIGTTIQNFSSSAVTFNAANTGTEMPYDIPGGTSYMWVTYDVSASAVVNDSLDATIPANGINVNGSTYNASIQNPAGKGYIYKVMSDFENGTSKIYALTPDLFSIGTMPSYDLSYGSFTPIPSGARTDASGNKVLGTNFGNSYNYCGGYYNASTPDFAATGVTKFSFYSWFGVDNYSDYFNVYYSTNSGSSWTLLALNTNASGGWVLSNYKVNTTNGQKIRIRFELTTGCNNLSQGVWIDDFAINMALSVSNDVTPPVVTINTPIPNQFISQYGSFNISNLCSISDGAGLGVDTASNGKIRIFIRKKSQPNSFYYWKSFTATSSLRGNWSSISGYSFYNGFNVGDTFQYFVTAQDLNFPPLVGSFANVSLSNSPPNSSLTEGSFPVSGSGLRTFVITGDVTPPVVSGTIASSTSVTTYDVSLSVDDAGVGTQTATTPTNLRPRLYYKLSTSANTLAGWSFVSASTSGSPFTFTLNLASISAVPGSTIQYFVVGQDVSTIPNVGYSSGISFASAPSSVVLTSAQFPIGGTLPSYAIPSTPYAFGSMTVTPVTTENSFLVSTNNYVAASSKVILPVARIAVTITGNSGTALTISSFPLARNAALTAASNIIYKLYRSSSATFDSATATRMGTGTITGNTASTTVSGSTWGMPYSLPTGVTYFYVTATPASNCAVGTAQAIKVMSTTTGITIGGTARTTAADVVSTFTQVNRLSNFESNDGGFTSSFESTQPDLNGNSQGPFSKWSYISMPNGTISSDPNYYYDYDPQGDRFGGTGKVWGSANGSSAPAVSIGAYNAYSMYSPVYASTTAVTAYFSWWENVGGDGYYSANNCLVYSSADGGASWNQVATSSTFGYWTFRNMAISIAANTTLQLRFVQVVDNAYQYNGTYIDDFYTTASLVTTVDAVKPVITINTAITNGTVQTLRTVSNVVTITDATPSSGINVTATTAPRLYFKKSGDANSSAGWKYVEAINTTSPFNFTINYSLLNAGSVSIGDVINYFVVAQDGKGNAACQSTITAPASITSVALTSGNLTSVAGFSSFTITTGPRNLANTIVTHPSSTAYINTTNQQVLKVELQVGGSTGTLSLTSLQIAGVTNNYPTNLGNLKLWSSGTTNNFSSATQIGSTTTFSGFGSAARATFSGLSVNLPVNSTYLWVTMDVPSTATSGNLIDATIPINGITVTDGTTPTTSPASLLAASGTITLGYPDLGFTISRTTGNIFTSIKGTSGAVTSPNIASTDDGISDAIDLTALNFTGFTYQGRTVTTINQSANGVLALNTVSPVIDYGNTSINANYIMALYDDLSGNSGDPENHFSYKLTGTAPNQVLTFEWLSMTLLTNNTADLNFQIKLYQADSHIEFVYGTMIGFTGTDNASFSYTCGLTGLGNTGSLPLGQALIQKYANTTNFRNESNDTLAAIPACNSMMSFVVNPTATFNSTTPAVPSNINIATATTLSVNTGLVPDFCVAYVSSGAGAFANNGSIVAVSGSNPDDGSWFSFVNSQTQNINIYVSAAGGFQPVVQLMQGSSPYTTMQSLSIAEGSKGTLTYNNLPSGTYYVRVYNYGLGAMNRSFLSASVSYPTAQFNILIYKTATPPANDDCSGAIALTNFTGTESLYSTLNATAGTNVPAAADGSGLTPADDDVWFTVTSSANILLFTIRGVGVFNPVLEVWKDACPSNSTNLSSRLAFVSGYGLGTAPLSITNPNSGSTTYYLRVYDYITGVAASGTSQFYISTSIPLPSCPTILTGPANGATGLAYDQEVNFTWNSVGSSSTISYKVYLGTNSNPADSLYTTQTGTSFSTLPTPGVLNYFFVKAVSMTNGTSQGCSGRSFRVLARPTTVSTCFFRTSSNYNPLSGLFNSAAVWEASTDSITWAASSIVPTGLAKAIVVNNGAVVTLSATDTVRNLIINSGASLVVNNGQQLIIAPDANNANRRELIINGTLTNAGTITPLSGISTADLVIGSTGTYEYNSTTPGTIPLATWNSGSTFVLKGLTSSTGTWVNDSQNFTNLNVSLPSNNSSTINLASKFPNISGNVTVSSTGTGKVVLSGSETRKTNIPGNLTVSGGTLDLNNGSGTDSVKVDGNLVLSGGTIAATAGNTIVQVKGNVSQTNASSLPTNNHVIELAGTTTSTVSAGTSGARFAKLRINKSGATTGDRNITTSGKVVISDSLHFVSGSLTTSIGDTVLLNTTGKLAGESSGNKVIGIVKANATLGTGASSSFGNIGTAITINGTAAGATTVTRVNNGTMNFTNNRMPGSTNINRVYDINPTTDANLNATLVFSYLPDELKSISPTSLQLIRSTNQGTTWINVPNGVINTTNNTITKTGISAFSYWTAGDSAVSLPVTYLSFNGFVKTGFANLQWRTATELNNKGFEIERSYDGKTFAKVGWIAGHGNSNSIQSYSYSLPFDQSAYFRLRQVDFNGNSEYSSVINLVAGNVAIKMSVQPIPVSSLTDVTFSPVSEEAALVMTLVSSQGVQVSQFEGKVKDASAWLKEVQNQIPSGVYVINAFVENQALKVKMVK